jgi:hypothetical protein
MYMFLNLLLMTSAALLNFVRMRRRSPAAPAPAAPNIVPAAPAAPAPAFVSVPAAAPEVFFVGTLYSSTRDRGAYLYGRKKDFLRGYQYHVVLKDSTGMPLTVEVEGPRNEDRLVANGDQITIPMLRETFTLYRDDKHPYDARIF